MTQGKKSPSPKRLLVVAAAVVDADGRVLVRELAEELGIETWGSCLAPAAFASEPLGDRHLLLLLYVCRKWRGIPQPLHCPELRWVRPVELHGLDMPPADRPLIGLLEALL
jgi:8-oxo-dGTP diphosphatase